MPETLLTVKDVAKRLAVGRTTVYELISHGGLRTVKIGRARRIPESALEEWIAERLRCHADILGIELHEPRPPASR